MVYADGQGNFFVDEQTASKFKQLMNSPQTQSSTVNSIVKNITFENIVIVLAFVVLALFLQGNAQFFILGALVMYVGFIL
jgi:ABC-type transport system involved in cytochrome c biogenesis permease component